MHQMIKDEGRRGVDDKFVDSSNSHDNNNNDDEIVSNDGSQLCSFEGKVIAERYRVDRKVDMGSYGVIYSVTDILSREIAAMSPLVVKI